MKELELGRIRPDADIDSITVSRVGGGHLLVADGEAGPPTAAAAHNLVTGRNRQRPSRSRILTTRFFAVQTGMANA